MFDMLRRKVGREGMVIGIDFCSNMVKKARKNFPFENVYPVDADVEDIPLVDGAADIAITFAAFAHFTDPAKVIKEVSRILKPGGQFHIIHLMGSGAFEDYHHKAGGPLAGDQLPSFDDMMHLYKLGKFVNPRINDHPGLYVASATKA
jgi:ubiquinone/menaquinone biosynthesis C-methylase UbiE